MEKREIRMTPTPRRNNEMKPRFNEASTSKQKPKVFTSSDGMKSFRIMDDGQMVLTTYTRKPSSMDTLQTASASSARTSPMMKRTNNDEWSVSLLRGQNLQYTSSFDASRPHIVTVPRGSNKTNQSLDASKKDYGTCVICISEESRLALVPCGHVCLCETCSPQFKRKFDRCPICQEIYTGTLKIYLGGS